MREPIGDWNDVTEKLPEKKATIVWVKLTDQSERYAFYYQDKMRWIEYYGQTPSYFWDYNSKQPLFNVTHWKGLLKKD